MNDLEDITEKIHKAYFVDLFVRVSNATAIQMYNKVSACQVFLDGMWYQKFASTAQIVTHISVPFLLSACFLS